MAGVQVCLPSLVKLTHKEFECVGFNQNRSPIGGCVWNNLEIFSFFKVAASTGHSVTLVDTSDDILKKSIKLIEGSLKRVAKKKFSDKPEVRDCKFTDKMSSNISHTMKFEQFLKNVVWFVSGR